MKRVLSEAFCVLTAGCLLALVANQVSPRGLSLSRNYFPASAGNPELTNTGNGSTNIPPGVLLKLKEAGLRPVDTAEMSTLFQDPRYQQNFVLFVDARNDEKYQAGHIPGAWQFDYYRPEPYLPSLFPLVQVAHQVVVYCAGGDCEDSQLAAIFLVDNGIPKDKVGVYTGGIKEWVAAGLPLQRGPRADHNPEPKEAR